MADLTITITVDTATITQSNVDTTVSISDSAGDPTTTNPEDFVSNVKAGDSVEWKGVPDASYPNDTVSITKIEYEGQDNIFGQTTLNGSGGTVTGTVQSNTQGEEEQYKIYFTVVHNSGNPQSFYLDPFIDVDDE